jgi:hypothetical protein
MPVMRPAAAAGPAALPEGSKETRGTLTPGTKAQPPAPRPRPRAGMQYIPPSAKPVVETSPTPVETPENPPKPRRAAPERSRREKRKADPKLVAAARELRDRWLEHVNGGRTRIESAGKYDVSKIPRAVEGSRTLSNAGLPPALIEEQAGKPVPPLLAA